MRKKNDDRLRQKIITGGFIVMLFLPGLSWAICGPIIEEDRSENRTLASKPVFDIRGVEKFPKQFDAYYNDHVPFRGVIREAWTKLNVELMHDSIAKSVVIGDSDGKGTNKSWLFYSEMNDRSPVFGVQGIQKASDVDKQLAIDNIERQTKLFEEQGKNFYFLMIPNKENIYREYLPGNIDIYNDSSRDEQVFEALHKAGFDNVLYVKDEIVNAKKLGQLYYKQDTHWNELGAFYGYKAFMQEAEPNFDEYSYAISVDEDANLNKDLAMFLGLRNYFVDDNIRVKYLDDNNVDVEKSGNGTKQIVVSTNQEPIIDKDVLLVGDSYRVAFVPYIQKVYRHVISMHRDAYDKKKLNEYDPDIVISEAVERYGASAAKFSFL